MLPPDLNQPSTSVSTNAAAMALGVVAALTAARLDPDRGRAGRPVPRRGAVLVLGAASRPRLLLETALGRLDDRPDHGAVRRQRVRRARGSAAGPCRNGAADLRDRGAALRPQGRVLGGARLCEPAGNLAVVVHHLDRRGIAAVLGRRALCPCPGAREGGAGWWIAVGIAAGLGLLAKYAMAYWLVSALIYVLAVPTERRHLPRLLAAAGLGVLIYLPNLWWNWHNGFVSYLHVRDNADIAGPLFPSQGFRRVFSGRNSECSARCSLPF